MKKLLCLLVCMMIFCCFGAQAESRRIIDDAQLFTDEDEKSLSSLIEYFQSATGMDFVIYTSSAYHENSQQTIADDLYDYGGYGLDDENSGILYFIDMYERIPYLSTTGAMIDYMTDERIAASHDANYHFLVNGQYAEAAAQMISSVYEFWQKGIPEGQYRYDIITGQILTARHKVLTGSELLVCALIGLVAALLFIKNVQGSYTLKGNTYHYAFRENSSVKLTDAEDTFMFTTTNRIRLVQHTSSSSSSESSGGSGVHTSSSGTSHGGGAGKRF